jgi:hypothetical protein
VNEQEQEKFEAELRRTRLARVPDDFMTRLRAAKPGTVLTRRTQHFQPAVERPVWRDLLRWLAPGLGLAAAVLLVAKVNFNSESGGDKTPLANVAYGMKADGVQVDQELVSSFDVVAKLPSGEPVRFRCRKWKDQLVVTDKSAGIEIGQSNPRVEVVPVRFETY